jgi:hypothetical protein
MYARSLTSALSQSFVAACNTFCTMPCDSSGFFKNSLTMAVSVCSWTYGSECSSSAGVHCTHRVRLLLEGVQECPQQLVCILDLLRIFPNDPDQRRSSLRLVQLLQVRTECWYDALIAVRVFTEDVLAVSTYRRQEDREQLTLITMTASCTT